MNPFPKVLCEPSLSQRFKLFASSFPFSKVLMDLHFPSQPQAVEGLSKGSSLEPEAAVPFSKGSTTAPFSKGSGVMSLPFSKGAAVEAAAAVPFSKGSVLVSTSGPFSKGSGVMSLPFSKGAAVEAAAAVTCSLFQGFCLGVDKWSLFQRFKSYVTSLFQGCSSGPHFLQHFGEGPFLLWNLLQVLLHPFPPHHPIFVPANQLKLQSLSDSQTFESLHFGPSSSFSCSSFFCGQCCQHLLLPFHKGCQSHHHPKVGGILTPFSRAIIIPFLRLVTPTMIPLPRVSPPAVAPFPRVKPPAILPPTFIPLPRVAATAACIHNCFTPVVYVLAGLFELPSGSSVLASGSFAPPFACLVHVFSGGQVLSVFFHLQEGWDVVNFILFLGFPFPRVPHPFLHPPFPHLLLVPGPNLLALCCGASIFEGYPFFKITLVKGL